MEGDDKKPFDKFELATAILLGLTAVGAALAGQQSGQWGGKQLEAFSAANVDHQGRHAVHGRHRPHQRRLCGRGGGQVLQSRRGGGRRRRGRGSGGGRADALERELPDEVLLASLGQELDDEYIDGALAAGTQMFADADKKFEEGKQANDNGDKFDLAVVLYTVALFFAGLGLVFKTRLRWSFFVTGAVFFAVTSIYSVSAAGAACG